MRKNSTDRLMTLNFWRMCTTNLLLFASVYMLFPVLSFVMPEQLGMSVSRTGDMFLVFIAAMFAAGPFHAYLCDEYKRKNVLLPSAFVMLAAMAGYAFADSYLKLMLLASVQGVFRTGNDGGHYGGYRHYHIYKAQCRQSGLCVVCPAGYAGRGVRRLPAVRPLRFPHGCLCSRCRGSSRHVFRIEVYVASCA